MRSFIAGLVLLAGMWGAVAAHAQCPSFDPVAGFPGAANGFTLYSPGTVSCAIKWDPDGPGPEGEWLVVGGRFDFMDGVRANGIAAWDGTRWRAFGNGLTWNQNNEVAALEVYNGELIAGGNFTNAGPGGVLVNHVARWNGTAWVAMAQGMPGGDLLPVGALRVWNGQLYVGGLFAVPNSQTRNVARWSGTAWVAVGPGLAGSAHFDVRTVVGSLEVYQNTLIAGGSFGSTNLPAAPRTLARLAPDSEQWVAFSGVGWPNQNDYITSILVEGDTLTVSGSVTLSGIPNNYARYDGAAWTGYGGGANVIGPARGMARNGAGELLAAGLRDGSIGRLQRWTGTAWAQVGQQVFRSYSGPGSVRVLGRFDGRVLVGGAFQRLEGTPNPPVDFQSAYSLVTWNDSVFSPITRGLDRRVCDFTRDGNAIVAVGRFRNATGVPCGRVARFDGTRWTPMGQGFDADAFATTIHNGRVIAGGDFTTADGQPALRVAAWNGTGWEPMGDGINRLVRELASVRGELVARCISSESSPTSTSVFVWNGSVWNMVANSDQLRGFMVHGDELYATQRRLVNQVLTYCVVRYTGTGWEPVGDDLPSQYFAGVWRGDLIAVNGTRTAKLVDGAWVPIGAGMSVPFAELVPGPEFQGELYAGGRENAEAVYRWNGATWTNIGFLRMGDQLLFASHPATLEVYDGDLFIGGAFGFAQPAPPETPPQTTAFYLPTGNIARWQGVPRPLIVAGAVNADRRIGEDAAFSVSSATPGVTYQWRFNGVAIVDGPGPSGSEFEGTTTPNLIVRNVRGGNAGAYQVLVSIACASSTSTATLNVRCDSDYNIDGGADMIDVFDLANDIASGQQSFPPNSPDFNGDGAADSADIFDLVNTVSGGVCP